MTVFVDSINIIVNEETESCGEWSYLYIYIQTSYFVVTLKSWITGTAKLLFKEYLNYSTIVHDINDKFETCWVFIHEKDMYMYTRNGKTKVTKREMITFKTSFVNKVKPLF